MNYTIKRGKRGSFEFEIPVMFILGLIITAMILFWIFQEGFFDEDAIDLETCRQSVILRNTLPELDVGTTIFSFKDDFPLKCRNNVVNVDYEDTERFEREFAESLITCWYLFGNGEYGVFPEYNWYTNSFCTFCTRFHLNSDVKEFYSKEENKIDLSRALSGQFQNGVTYYEYLTNIGDEDPFKLVKEGGGFQGETFEMSPGKSRLSPSVDAVSFTLPHYLDVENGDLFVMYQNFISQEGATNMANLFYFQQHNARFDGKTYSALEILSDNVKSNAIVRREGGVLGWIWWDSRSSICSTWDGIPQ